MLFLAICSYILVSLMQILPIVFVIFGLLILFKKIQKNRFKKLAIIFVIYTYAVLGFWSVNFWVMVLADAK